MTAQQAIGSNWKQLKEMVREKWEDLTDEELNSFDGSVKQLVTLIESRTGEEKDEIAQALEEMMQASKSFITKAATTVRHAAEQSATSLRNGYDGLTERWQEGREQADEMVRTHPTQSVAVALGAGVLVGVIIGLVMRSR